MPISNDPLLEKVKAKLPAGWKLANEGNLLYIRRAEPVWVLFDNRINAPFALDHAKDQDARIQKFGSQVTAGLTFRCEPRWTPENFAQARKTNTVLDEEIRRLPKKHAIEHLYDAHLSSKGEETYVPTNDVEKKRIAAYQEEKHACEARRTPLPNYQSSRLSLFLQSRVGGEDDLHLVFPASASSELYTIDALLRETLPLD